MGERGRALILAGMAAFGSLWAAWLVELHREAVAHVLLPGVLCSDGGCATVLGSQWSTVGPFPVSAPAIGLYGAVALAAVAVAAGRASAARVGSAAALAAALGLLFGAYLGVRMAQLGDLCKYCLIMDASTVGVGLAALFLHPAGPAGVVGGWVAAARRPWLELGGGLAAVAVALLTLVVAPEPGGEPPDQPVVIVLPGAPDPVVPEGTRKIVVPTEATAVPLGPDAPIRGRVDAPITIVLFEDFECPYCRRLATNLETATKDRSDVRLAWFDFPMNRACNAADLTRDLHPDACAAAAAGRCAQDQGKFWEMHDQLFGGEGALSSADLAGYAKAVGLDPDAFAKCVADPATMERVRASSSVGAGIGVRGTPTFLVQGRRFVGAQGAAALTQLIDAIAKLPVAPVAAGEVLGDVPPHDPVSLVGPRGPFTIDPFEASIVEGKARSAPGVESARGVTWYQADAACRAAGRRLCTEDEWLTACTGAIPVDHDGDGNLSEETLARAHPYGPDPQPTWCASARTRNDPRPLVTGAHPKCGTPDGVYDLEGLTKEWVGTTPGDAGLKGGSYFSGDAARCAFFKEGQAPDDADPANGFRCCSGPEPVLADTHPGGKVGDPVAKWSLPLIDGGTVSAASLAGKPYVITFWASYCGPCRKEMPLLSQLYQKYQDQGFVVVGVDIDKDPAKARQFLQSTPVRFPIALDSDSSMMAGFATRGTPTTFWVTKSGKIRQRTIGYDEKGAIAVLDGNVKALLAAE